MNPHPDKYDIDSSLLSKLADDPLLGAPRDPEMAQLLDMVFPEYVDSLKHDGIEFAEEDAQQLEALYERFGLPLRVNDNPENVLTQAYLFCSVYFGKFVNTRMRRPKEYAAITKSWPQDWHDYVDAVLSKDLVAAKTLAKKLQVMTADCEFPEFVENPWRD